MICAPTTGYPPYGLDPEKSNYFDQDQGLNHYSEIDVFFPTFKLVS